MAEQQRRSLRNLMINRSAQGSVISVVIVAGFFSSLFCGALFYIYIKSVYDSVFASASVPGFLVEEYYADLLAFGLTLVIISMFVTLVTAFYALVISHRSAGACYRLQVVIEEVKAGNTKARVYLRQKDEHQALAQSFNDMMDAHFPSAPVEEAVDTAEESVA